MKPSEEADVIADHVFESESNLRITAKLGLAFPKVKERIVREFVQTLALELGSRLGKQWGIENSWTERPLRADCQIGLAKKPWLDKASIGLTCERTGPSFLLYFVWRASKHKLLAITDLKQSLDKRFSHGNHYSPPSGGDTLWWKYVDDHYRDWDNEDMLVTLWKKGLSAGIRENIQISMIQ